MYDELLAFYKKINKKKHIDRGDEDGADEDGYDDEDDDDMDDDDEEENEASYKFNQEEHRIDDIEKLRDDRHQVNERKQKMLAEMSTLETRLNKLKIQESTIKSRLEDTEDMIQDFQREKMDKLNQLSVSIVLKISQLQNLEKDEQEYQKWEKYREENQIDDPSHFDNSGMNGYGSPTKGGMTSKHHAMLNSFGQAAPHQMEEDYRGFFLPLNLKDSTLFTRDGLLKLIDRKRQLDQQIEENKAIYKAKKDELKAINRQIKENQRVQKQKLEEYNEKQMLRFGCLQDLDSLEVAGPSQTVIDLRNKQNRIEKECMRKREEAEAHLESTQRELTRSVKENTVLLELIIELGKEQIDYNEKLDQTKQAILEDENADQKKQILREKQELREVLQLQSRKIETLKTEINLYKRKGGHIYTKVTTNRRNANLNQNE